VTLIENDSDNNNNNEKQQLTTPSGLKLQANAMTSQANGNQAIIQE